ncbi:MAG TPA: hypothetical protein PKO09_06780 [Anaerolineae bacterium]|nr:hypothetical protein [Anaerolineae bacterium]
MPHSQWVIARRAGSTALAAVAVVLVVVLGMPPGARAHSSDLSPRLGPGNEVSMGSRESGLFYEYTIEGADCGERQADGSVTCTLTSDRVTASGTLYVSLGDSLYTRPSAEAKLGGSAGTPEENVVSWPPPELRDAEGYVSGPFEHEESFDFSYDVQPEDAYVALTVWVGKVNGASEGAGVGAWMYRPAATPTVSPECSSVPLSYSPDPPRAGDDVYLNAGVSSTVGNAPGFYSRWELDGDPLSGSVIEEWSGCAEAVKYVYFCEGAERFETMILPGGDCLEGVGWRGVVGAAGLAAAAAAAAVGLRRARRGRKSKGPEEYILQLSVDEVKIAAGQSAPVTATVWQVTPQGGYVPAPQASLRLAVSPTPAGLKALPASGMGTLTFQVSADAGCPGGTGSVQVQGRAGGTYYRSTVTVEVGSRYSVEMACQDPQRLVPAAPGEVWAYARVVSAVPLPQADLDKLTRTIRFSITGPNAGAVEMRDEQFSNGWQAVRLFQVPAKVSGPGSPTLLAQATVGGSPLKPGELELSLKTPVVLSAWVRGGKEADLVYDARGKSWDIPDVHIYFHAPGDDRVAVKPSFPYGFASPPVVVAPALLVVQEFFGSEKPDQFLLRLKPAPGADLAKAAGAGSAVLRVTVTAIDTESKQPYTAGVTLRLKRQAELQFSPKEMKLKPGQPADLEITLSEVGGSGSAAPVPGARISLQPSRQIDGLTIAPLDGPSPLKVQLQLEEVPEDDEEYHLEVRGEAAGLDPVAAPYPVEIATDYAVEFRYPEDLSKRGEHRRSQFGLPPDTGLTAHAVALDRSQDPAAPDDMVTKKVLISPRGSNEKCVDSGAEAFAGGAQTTELRFVWPGEGVVMEDDDPELVAQLKLGEQPVEGTALLNLDECRLAVLRRDLDGVAGRLFQQGWYVRNPLLGGATGPVLDYGYRAWSFVWDWTAGWVAQRGRGRTCQEFVEETRADVLKAVRRVYGDRARLETMVVREVTEIQTRPDWWGGTMDYLDSWYPINHILFKLTAPKRKEYSIDFWEHFRYPTVHPPVLESWATTVTTWLKRLEGDINVGVPFTEQDEIQPGKTPPAVRGRP